MTPVFKKGRKTITDNYRQISLLTVSSKVIRRIIRQIITENLVKYNLINKEQHGFVLKKSCLTNLLKTIDVISDTRDFGFSSAIVFMDFAKAFEKVCLFIKSEADGFKGSLLESLSDFLKDRRLGDNVLYWKAVLSGVPQGSVLGPLLFVIYINDMPGVVKNVTKLFADDTLIIATI